MTVTARQALWEHWPEYLIEAWALGMFMISAGLVATLLGFPGSPVHRLIPEPMLRSVLGGVAMVIKALTEVIPASVRTTGFSLAYSLATTIGGSSLAISTWLIRTMGDKAAPGYWMSFAALCGLCAAPYQYRKPKRPVAMDGAATTEPLTPLSPA